MPVTSSGVEEGSPAQRHGIRAGERLVSINGHPIEDVLDYRFYLTDTRLKLELEGSAGPAYRSSAQKERIRRHRPPVRNVSDGQAALLPEQMRFLLRRSAAQGHARNPLL